MNQEKFLSILGWVATATAMAMYISYIPQIGSNLSGHKSDWLQPLVAGINCVLWVGSGPSSLPTLPALSAVFWLLPLLCKPSQIEVLPDIRAKESTERSIPFSKSILHFVSRQPARLLLCKQKTEVLLCSLQKN